MVSMRSLWLSTIVAGLLFWAFVTPTPTKSDAIATEARDSGRNVIFITWDGIRRDEFLGFPDPALAGGDTAPLLPYFWEFLAPRGQIYGDPRQGKTMTVANLALISLPAYESIFAGQPQLCDNNEGPRVAQTTFPERLVHELGLAKEDVVTFASWQPLQLAVESQPGTTLLNAGNTPAFALGDDGERVRNHAQAANPPPWNDCRYDRYTWQHALAYLNAKKPRFMYLSFDDADAWGHAVDYPEYLSAIRRYDGWLRETVEALQQLGEYGRNTCLVITTDHGRGEGKHWHTHSNGHLYSGLTFMYAGCPLDPKPAVFAPPQGITTHLDIRPTIEALFGLQPQDCLLCGKSLLSAGPLAIKP